MGKKEVSPSVKETAFCCPYCGVLTTQHWMNVSGEYRSQDHLLPSVFNADSIEKFEKDREIPQDQKKDFLDFMKERAEGNIFLESEQTKYHSHDVVNLNLSECYNCHRFAVWVHERLVFPFEKGAVEPNSDLPKDITRDYEEARDIVNLSPRGAAALLRLCIQKLCAHLGGKGKKIDDDIASLVKKGLNPLVQKSLDVVRVIGNDAVHPGSIDIKDDVDTANKLFSLVNIIVEQMISNPKKVEELYAMLPPAKLKAIEKRDESKEIK